MFRFKESIPLSYERQGYIYFKSLLYRELPKSEQARIRQLCRKAAGANADALLEFVTGRVSATSVCMRHYIASNTTLYRALRRYYMLFDL